MPDAINLSRLSIPARARVLELRAARKNLRCNKCGKIYHWMDHRWWDKEARSRHYGCGEFTDFPAPVYVKRRGNGWQVGTVELPGWALVLG